MPSIYEYTDYRDIIRDFYLEKKEKNAKYSYSVLGMAIGLNASHVFCIVEKKRNLPVRCVPAIKKVLGLTGRAARYFDLLLAASRTKSEKTREEILAKAVLLRDVKKHVLQDKEIKYLSDWWTPVIRALIEVNQGKVDIKTIAEWLEPAIGEDKVQESVNLLKDLGFIQDLGNGRVKIADSHINISGEERAQAIRAFQAAVMQSLGNSFLDFCLWYLLDLQREGNVIEDVHVRPYGEGLEHHSELSLFRWNVNVLLAVGNQLVTQIDLAFSQVFETGNHS